MQETGMKSELHSPTTVTSLAGPELPGYSRNPKKHRGYTQTHTVLVYHTTVKGDYREEIGYDKFCVFIYIPQLRSYLLSPQSTAYMDLHGRLIHATAQPHPSPCHWGTDELV